MSSEGVDVVSGAGDERQGLVPKRRFPEFRDAGAWRDTILVDVLLPTSRDVAKPSVSYTGLGLRSHGKGTFQKPEQNPEKNAMDRLYVVHRNDLIVNITFAWEGAIAIADDGDHGCFVSHRFPTYEFKQGASSPDFFRYVITDKAFVYRLGVISPGGAGRNRVMNKNDFLRLSTLLPSPAEQQKIADCLSSLDAVIAAEGDRLVALKDHKKGLMQQLFPAKDQTTPRLRFPEFESVGEWEEEVLGNLVDTVTPPKKLPTSQYAQSGTFPIIDQSQDAICGWTDDFAAVVSDGLPHIIFGDHTCVLKLALSPFVQGADGIKILAPKKPVSVEFLFQSLLNDQLEMKDYRRHFSLLKERRVCFPDVKTGEQQKISDCLASLDTLLKALSDKISALKDHKKGLMQQLLPSPVEATA